MKKVLVVLFALAALVSEAQIQTPAASPSGTVTSVVGFTEVKVEYSRPKMKGRKIFGTGAEFVTPYAQTLPWRTGANQGSKVTFSDSVKFGGVDVPKGTYLLLTFPGATEWTVVLYKDVAMGGNTSGYDKSKDAARATVKPTKLTETVETFTIEIADIAENNKSANFQIMWENTSVKVPITVDFDKKVMASINSGVSGSYNNLFNAASYYYESGKDLKQALSWVNTSIAANPDAYWQIHLKAKIQKALGDKKGAIETANLSKSVAQKAPDAAYVKLNDDLIKSIK